MAEPDPFRSPLVGEDPIARAQRVTRRQNNWRNTVLRRQRILKAHGYNVPVDGNWGKRSSSAWWRFRRNKPPIAGRRLPKAPAVMGENAAEKARTFKPEPAPVLPPSPASSLQTISQRAVRTARDAARRAQERPALDLSHSSAKALAAAPRKRSDALLEPPVGAPTMLDRIPDAAHTAARRRATELRIAAEAQARFKRAWGKKSDPGKWDTRDIVALYGDPTTRVKDWQNKPEWVERLQRWLRAHGSLIGVTGRWDAYTADALQSEMERRKRNLARWRARVVARKLYTPLGIKPGDKGFPLLGTAPTPEKLLEMADEGGFSAQFVFKSLAERLNDIQLATAWRNYQEEFLDSLLRGGKGFAQARSAFGPFLTPLAADWMTPQQKYAAILLGMSSIGAQGEAQGEALGKDGVGFSVENDPRRKGDTFYQEVRAVAEANSPEELRAKIAAVRQADEKLFQHELAKQEEGKGWFLDGAGAVLHALGVPAEETQDVIVAAYAGLRTSSAGLSRAGRGQGWDEFEAEHARLQALWNQWERDHAVLGFVVDLVVDPLNLIPATWVAAPFRATKFGLKAMERAGEAARVATAGHSLPVRLVGEGAGAALTLAPSYGRGVKALGVGTKTLLKQSKVGRLNRTVRESMDDVTRTVRTAMNHGFTAAKETDPADTAAIKDGVRKWLKGVEATDPTTGRTFNILDEIERFGVTTVDEMTGFFTDLVNLASRQRLSFYTHASRGTVSDFGRSVEGALGSNLYSMHADKWAWKQARDEFDSILKSVHDDLVGQAEFRAKLKHFHDLVQKRETARGKGRDLTPAEQAEYERAAADWRGYVRSAKPKPRRGAVPTPKVKHTIPTVRDQVTVDLPEQDFAEMLERIAKTESERVYIEAMKRAGSFLGGGSFEVTRMLEQEVLASLELYHATVLPALQNAVERSLLRHESGLVAAGKRPEGWTPRGLFTDSGFATGNRAKSSLLLRDLLRDTFDDLDEAFPRSLDSALNLPNVKKFRAQRIAEVNEEFDLRLQALDERVAKLRQGNTDLRESLFGEKLAELHRRDGGDVLNTPLREITETKPDGRVVRRMETPEEAAKRFADEFGYDLSKFTVKAGESVKRFPVLVSKQDNAVIFGNDAIRLMNEGREAAKGYFLSEARIGADGKVKSLSNDIVDLESGELRYEVERFAADAVESPDPKFRKAIEDLKRLNKRIAEMQNRKRQAARAKDPSIREHGWSREDDRNLGRLFASKRRLIEQNPATETYFARGKMKRAVTRHVEGMVAKVGDDALPRERMLLQEEKNLKLAEVENEVHQLAEARRAEKPLRDSKVWVPNADVNRIFTQDEYDEFIGMMMERRSRSVSQWAARRRANGDMASDAIERAVEKAMVDEQSKLAGWFKPQGNGTFKMTYKGARVPAIYARHAYGAYAEALAGRHPILTAADVPDDVKRVLSLAATPADRAPGAARSVERMAAMLSGARPFPTWKKFSDDPALSGAEVKGRNVSFERSTMATAPRVGVAAGTRLASETKTWGNRLREIRRRGWEYREIDGGPQTDFLGRYEAYHAMLKVAAEHSYSRASLRQGAVIRALKEAQSGPLREINSLLDTARELFVFSVLPGRPGALFRNVFDSVVKILVHGYVDPRYWFAGGSTTGELEARAKLKAISGDARAAVLGDGGVSRAVTASQDALSKIEDVARNPVASLSSGQLDSVTNIFQLGINELELALRLMVGPKYADAIATRFSHAFNTAFWARPLKEVRKALQVNAVDVPDEVIFGVQTVLHDGVAKKLMPRERVSLEDWAAINQIRKGDVEDWIKSVTSDPKRLNDTRHPVFVLMSHTANVNWDLMVGRPEGFLRRGLYRSAYARALKRTGDEVAAHAEGMRAVDKSLFDYSKTTVLDENLRHLIPFFFFWRRNLRFWAVDAIRKPYLPAAVVKFEDMMDQVNADQPPWARRYLKLPFLNDTLSKLPVVNWLLGASPDGFEVGTDPMSWLSAAPLYRAFKGENPQLPPDRAGLPFISGLVEGMNDFGLSMSPWFRKPAELAGVLDYRAWQVMFPQTSVVDAFSTRFLHEMFPHGLNFEEALQDALFDVIGVGINSQQLNERRVNEWVQTEMAAQANRGEPVDRAAAEKKVRQFVYLQTMFAFVSGAYLRHLDPSQLHLYKIQQQLVEEEVDFLDLSEEEQKAYRLFIRRKLSPGAYNDYVAAIPKIEAHDAIEDFEDRQDYINRNPEIIPYVSPERRGKPLFRKGNNSDGLKNVTLIADTGATMTTLKVFDQAGIDEPGVRDRLSSHFVTPELQEFWSRNDTPAERRDRMLKGEVYRYLRSLRQDYFALPEKDHAARKQFLDDNPLLAHSFTVNDDASDDLKDVLNAVNADLREVYFEFVDRDDWDGAAEFLKRFPRMFEFTKAADRISDDGTWLPAAKNTQRAKDFLAAQRFIRHYWDLKKTNKKAAYKWLNGNTPGAKLARDYFTKYADPSKGSKGEHARDYLALKGTLTWFFDTLPAKGEFRGHPSKWDWAFESNDPAAVALRNYFRKYGDKNGMSQHAKDYVAVKDDLQRYFKMKESDAQGANDWLHSKAGAEVLAYFKKYGKTNAAARKWGSWVRSQNPEVNRRLMFWKRYFELEPDQRPGFVHSQAERYGVFVWGPEADQERHDQEQHYLRRAKKRHLTKKQALYLRVKPFLDLMHTLDKRDTKILLRLNPDVQEYLDTFGRGPTTGNKALDKKVETYFKLTPDSQDRADFLRRNPEVQDYFDAKNPADAAMHNILEVYFSIPPGRERNQFRDLHPEVSDYFDRKREEKSLLTEELRAFDEADPRDAELRERAQTEIVHAAEVMWARLRGDSAARLAGDDLQVRRERDERRRKTRRPVL